MKTQPFLRKSGRLVAGLVALALILSLPQDTALSRQQPAAPNPPSPRPALDLQIGHSAAVISVAFSPDGKTVASGSFDETVKLWDAQTGMLRRTLTGHSSWVWSVAFSPDGKTVASGGGQLFASQPGEVNLWDAQTGALLRTLPGHSAAVISVAFSPNGKTLASGSADKTVRLWDAQTGALRRTLSEHGGVMWSVAFSPDGKTLASGSGDTTVRLGDPISGRHLATLMTLPPREGEAVSTDYLAFTAEGYYDGSAGAGRFIKWCVGNDLFPIEAYERVFHRPQLVSKSLRGEAVPKVEREVQRFLAGELIPPQVNFSFLRDGQEVTGDSISVELIATDDKDPKEAELLVNGRPLATKPIPREYKPIPRESKPIPLESKPIPIEAKPIPTESKPIPREYKAIPVSHKYQRAFQARVPLPPGEKSVTLKAITYDDDDLQGWTEIRLVRRNAAPVIGDLYVLSVGVTQYQNPNFNLRYAARDADAFVDLWKQTEGTLYRRVIVARLTDAQATATNVRGALFRLIETATDKDSVAVFLSGHGVQDGETYYFATHEVDPKNLNDTALPWTVFQTMLAKLDAKRVLLFLDACHSGNSLGEQQANNERLAGELLRKNTGAMVFASSRGSEFSYELEEKQHGAFTAALIEGIGEGRADLDIGAGRDGIITPEELQTFLRARVPQLTGNLQTPICPLMRDFGDAFPLAKVK